MIVRLGIRSSTFQVTFPGEPGGPESRTRSEDQSKTRSSGTALGLARGQPEASIGPNLVDFPPEKEPGETTQFCVDRLEKRDREARRRECSRRMCSERARWRKVALPKSWAVELDCRNVDGPRHVPAVVLVVVVAAAAVQYLYLESCESAVKLEYLVTVAIGGHHRWSGARCCRCCWPFVMFCACVPW